MNVAQARLALIEFGFARNVRIKDGAALKNCGQRALFDNKIHYSPIHKKAWIDRLDNDRKSSIWLNLITGVLTYGYTDDVPDRRRLLVFPQ